MNQSETTDYQRGWSDCKNVILDLLHSFGPDLELNFGFVPPGDLEKICFAIAAQEPERAMSDELKTTEWRCFHCDEIFTDPKAARLHFGDDCMSDAACQISASAVREMEMQLARYRAEDSDTDRAIYRMRAEHTVALREAEEKGYRCGLIDQVFTNG